MEPVLGYSFKLAVYMLCMLYIILNFLSFFHYGIGSK